MDTYGISKKHVCIYIYVYIHVCTYCIYIYTHTYMYIIYIYKAFGSQGPHDLWPLSLSGSCLCWVTRGHASAFAIGRSSAAAGRQRSSTAGRFFGAATRSSTTRRLPIRRWFYGLRDTAALHFPFELLPLRPHWSVVRDVPGPKPDLSGTSTAQVREFSVSRNWARCLAYWESIIRGTWSSWAWLWRAWRNQQ